MRFRERFLGESRLAASLDHPNVIPITMLLASGGPDGEEHVYLTDFGLSTRLGDDQESDEPSEVLGSLDYVAPEQIEDRPVSAQTDVYALGCALFSRTDPCGAVRWPREDRRVVGPSGRTATETERATLSSRRPSTRWSLEQWRRNRRSRMKHAARSLRRPVRPGVRGRTGRGPETPTAPAARIRASPGLGGNRRGRLGPAH